MSLTQPIRCRKQVHAIENFYFLRNEIRNYVLIVLSINTALRICDLLRLTWDDVYDFDNKRFRVRIDITEQKTGKRKLVTLNCKVISALTAFLASAERGRVLFISRNGNNKAICRQQAYRIIRAAAEALDFTTRVSCHSLRKTFGYFAWKAGVSPMIIMKIYNHSSLAVTQLYLGITQDNIDNCYHEIGKITSELVNSAN